MRICLLWHIKTDLNTINMLDVNIFGIHFDINYICTHFVIEIKATYTHICRLGGVDVRYINFIHLKVPIIYWNFMLFKIQPPGTEYIK